MTKQHGTITRLLAARCEHCLICKQARKHPDSAFGKAVALHGMFCPFWRAWQKVYGEK